MKVALAQLNYHIGDFEGNVSKIKKAIAGAKRKKAELIVFAELAVCGYPPRDFLEFKDFINRCEQAIKEIAKECKGIAAIVGSPSRNPEQAGKNLFNSAYFLTDGKIKSIHHKALLPNYDVFDEYRYFEPARKVNIIRWNGVKIALTVCEDIWDIDNDLIYTFQPMEELKKQQPDIMINIAASPFDYAHAEERKKVLCFNARKYQLPLLYVNQVGSQTELIFDGGSMVASADGLIEDEMKYFEEEVRYFKIESTKYKVQSTKYKVQNLKFKVQRETESSSVNDVVNSSVNSLYHQPNRIKYEVRDAPLIKAQRMHDALVLGIRDYFRKMKFEKAIIGLSGGIDSAVVLVLAAKALGAENVKALLMPSRFSTAHSVDDAKQLAENLGCSHEILPIKHNYESVLKTLSSHFKNLPFNIAEENIQARLRAVLLMAFTNKFGYILLNTSNKSELAVGYGTLYGDMCGGLSVLGDVYKTEVYEIANYINELPESRNPQQFDKLTVSPATRKLLIPQHIIDKPPSAELRPDQKDSDSLPDYSLLDKILFQYIERRKSPEEIIGFGYNVKLVKQVLQMVNTNEYKRYQAPPILRVSPKAFGMGRRMPIVGKYL